MNDLTWNGEPFLWTQLDAWVGILTAVGTLFAVGVAVWVAVREHAARVAADARATAAETEERVRAERAQASRVLVTRERPAVFSVTNDSDLPIYAVKVHAYFPPDSPEASDTTDVIPPRASSPAMIRSWDRTVGAEIVTYVATFRDDGHRWWARFHSGDLVRIPGDTGAAGALVIARLGESYKAKVAPHMSKPSTGSGDDTQTTVVPSAPE